MRGPQIARSNGGPGAPNVLTRPGLWGGAPTAKRERDYYTVSGAHYAQMDALKPSQFEPTSSPERLESPLYSLFTWNSLVNWLMPRSINMAAVSATSRAGSFASQASC